MGETPEEKIRRLEEELSKYKAVYKKPPWRLTDERNQAKRENAELWGALSVALTFVPSQGETNMPSDRYVKTSPISKTSWLFVAFIADS